MIRKPSALVLDGDTVKQRLMAERLEIKDRLIAERVATGQMVHVDWVRFTCALRHAPFPGPDVLFHQEAPANSPIWDQDWRLAMFKHTLAQIPPEEFTPSVQAWELAQKVADVLGADFKVSPIIKKGQDFYRYRWAIERNDTECAWVGFLASSDKAEQHKQSQTIHANVFGSACTFAAPGWRDRLAQLIDETHGDVTRLDLALDFFDGMPGGMQQVQADYMAGLCDVRGRRPKCNMVGDWCNGHERSFYIGSREAGKQTNVYEKGDQLFGVESASPWMRAELRYGNKLRELCSDMLRRPADFFAGASNWHHQLLVLAGSVAAPQAVPVNQPLAAMTVQAEVARNIRWAMTTARATLATAWNYLGDDFLSLVDHAKLPGRLRRFSASELAQAFAQQVQSVGKSCPVPV
jgi:phage replication initiation protein